MNNLHLASIALLATSLTTGCTAYQQRIAFAGAGIAVSGLIVCDNRETVHVSDGGRWDATAPDGVALREMNPVLGRTPSIALLDGAAIGAVALTTFVANTDRLPTWSKLAYLAVVGAAEAAVVAGNSRYAPGACGM